MLESFVTTGPKGILGKLLQVGQLAEYQKTFFDLFASKRLQALGAEAFDGERSHDAAVEESALENFAVQVFLGGEVAHEASSEGIAGAGGIFDFFNRQCWGAEGMTANAKRTFA